MSPREREGHERAALGPWRTHDVGEEGGLDVGIGPLVLHFEATAGELRMATTRSSAEGEPADGAGREAAGRGPENGREWSRWAMAKWDGRVALTPAFPDRTLVVSPDEPFHLLQGAEARIYVRVPLWVEVGVGEPAGQGGAALTRLPTIPSSDTWWGTLDEGELAYWLTTHARRAVTEELFEHHLAMCPLQLVNDSRENLPVEKVALRVAYLSLFADGDRIWSDATRVRYQGEAEGSRLDMAGRPPREAQNARLLAPPRLAMDRGVTARTFARLRSLQEWVS